MAASFLCLFNRVSISVAGAERLIKSGVLTDASDSDPETRKQQSEERMGMVYSAYLLVYTIFMLPGGWLIDRFGTRFALGAMGVGAGVCVILTGVAGRIDAPAALFVSLLVIRGCLGLCSVPMFPGAARTVAAWLPAANRSMANGLVTAAALLGSAGTFYIFGALIERFDWPVAFWVTGFATLAFSAVWLVCVRSSPAEHPAVNPAEFRIIRAQPVATPTATTLPLAHAPSLWNFKQLRNLAILSISYALYGYFQYVFFFWSQYYFDDVLQLGVDTSRRYATYINLAMAVGMFAGGVIADALSRQVGPRWGRATVAGCGLLAGALFLYLGLSVTDPRWVITWLSLSVAAAGMIEGPAWVTAIEIGGRQGGVSAAIFNTIGNVGGIIGPAATPLIRVQYGWRAALLVGCLVCIAGALLWLFVTPAAAEVEDVEGSPA